jgi:hypothetical protein
MSRPNAVLFTVAFFYPIVSFLLLRWTSGITGIPSMEQRVLFAYLFPVMAMLSALGAKLNGVGLGWVGVLAFILWMGIVGWVHDWLITGIWAVI